MCLQYWEGDFSWKPCDSTLNTNRQNIGLDTEYNSNWDSPELFPPVHVIASDDEGITPLTVAAVLSLATPVRLSSSTTVPLCPQKNRYLPLMMTVDTFDYTVFSISSRKMRSHISQSFFAKIRIPVMTFGYNVQYWSQLLCNKKPLPLRDKTLKSAIATRNAL